jgi:hypothetical protein
MEPRELQCSICDSEFIEEVEEQSALNEAENPFLGLFGAMPGGTTNQDFSNSNTNLQQQMLVDLLSLLSNIPARNGEGIGGGRASVRLGDYVFGNLDDILEQLVDTPQQRGISDDEISQLERVEVEGECPVCQEEYAKRSEQGDLECKMTEQIRLPCKHVFHGECITKWLKVNGTCPVCRFSLLKENANSSNHANDGSSEEETRANQARELEDRANRFISQMFVPNQARETSSSTSEHSREQPGLQNLPNRPFGIEQVLSTLLGGNQSPSVDERTNQNVNPFLRMFDAVNSGPAQTQVHSFASPNGFFFTSTTIPSNRQSSDGQPNPSQNRNPSSGSPGANRETLYDPDVD